MKSYKDLLRNFEHVILLCTNASFGNKNNSDNCNYRRLTSALRVKMLTDILLSRTEASDEVS